MGVGKVASQKQAGARRPRARLLAVQKRGRSWEGRSADLGFSRKDGCEMLRKANSNMFTSFYLLCKWLKPETASHIHTKVVPARRFILAYCLKKSILSFKKWSEKEQAQWLSLDDHYPCRLLVCSLPAEPKEFTLLEFYCLVSNWKPKFSSM